MTDVATFVTKRTEDVNNERTYDTITQDPVSELELPPSDISSNDSDTDTEETLSQFVSAIDQFKNKVIDSYQRILK